MAQKYKVYFANRPVFFTHRSDAAAVPASGVSVFDSRGKMNTLLIENAIAQGARKIFILCEDVEEAWPLFYDQFEFVQAAGGLVVNNKNKILFIYRLEKWDLPKGKVEEGEDLDEAALREVEEECSINELTIESELCTTWHTYLQKGEPILKATAWYIMKYHGTKQPAPQLIEGITDTRWLGPDELGIIRSNTFPSVIDVVEAFLVTATSSGK